MRNAITVVTYFKLYKESLIKSTTPTDSELTEASRKELNT